MDNIEYERLLEDRKSIKEKIYWLDIELLKIQYQIENTYECVCAICDNNKWYKDDLPYGWGYLPHSSKLICDKCHDRWNKRFGEVKLERDI